MAQIVVVDWSNRKVFDQQLTQHFRLRHDIYVMERQWRDLGRPIDIEMDAFDTEHAIYLLALDNSGSVIGGSRLVPTTKPHLLCDVFPELANGTPPRAPDIYEWTRFFIAPAYRQRSTSSRVAGEVLCGLLELCLKTGIRRISVVCEAFWPERLKSLGWEVEVLGPQLQFEGLETVGILIQISEQALRSTRRHYGIDAAMLTDEAAPVAVRKGLEHQAKDGTGAHGTLSP